MNKLSHNNSVNRPARANSLVRQFLLGLIRAYQYVLSPWLGPGCRYLPSCSDYAREAIEIHGLWYGGWLAVRRIGRCHPLGASGYDPVPGASEGADNHYQSGPGDWHGH